MNLNRYKIEDGKYTFHTFTEGQKFNASVWLENDGRFEKKTEIILNEDGTESIIEVGYYAYYLQDGTPDLNKIAEDDLIQATNDWKASRQTLVDNIEVTYNGVIYQGDETSQDRMSRAINALPDEVTTVDWVAKDNSVHQLTIADLKQILFLAGQAQTAVWNTGRP